MAGQQQSITFKLTLLFATLSTVVLLLLGLLIGRSVEHHFEEQDLEVLHGKQQLTRHALERAQSQADLSALPGQFSDALIGHPGLFVVVLAPDGNQLFSSPGAEFPPELLARSPAGGMGRLIKWQTRDGQPMRGQSMQVQTAIAGTAPVLVAIATEISHHEHFMASFRHTLWGFMLLAAATMGLVGWFAVRRGLAPLQALRQQAEGITANRLDTRLPAESVPVELADLAHTLNAMLARLEESFHRLSDFSSDLAHELRTPVSNLLTQTHVALSKSRSAEEYREVLASNSEEFERLSRMIADMLFLAKADNLLIVPSREQVDLQAEVESLLEFYDVLAEEKNIRISCHGQALLEGDRLMLRRAIGNVLSNAIRHTPDGGYIHIELEQVADKSVSLSIENSGETIPAEHLPRLFDRFYRADPSRHREGEGAGLGLAITRSIMRAHGGEVSVASAQGATVFVFRFD